MLRGGGGGVGVGLRRGQRRENHKSSVAAQNALQDGQSVILAVRDPVVTSTHHGTKASDAPSLNHSSATSLPAVDAPATGAPVTESEATLTAKNYRLAKELSDVRVRHREEHKNVTRLTMENMNLASRCREAISQAAILKQDLSQQKRKTAEAVAQTHLLLEQLKRFKQQQNRQQQQNLAATSGDATSGLSPIKAVPLSPDTAAVEAETRSTSITETSIPVPDAVIDTSVVDATLCRPETPPLTEADEKLPLTPVGPVDVDTLDALVPDPSLEYMPTTNSDIEETGESTKILEIEQMPTQNRLESKFADVQRFLTIATTPSDEVVDGTNIIPIANGQFSTINPMEPDDSEHKNDSIDDSIVTVTSVPTTDCTATAEIPSVPVVDPSLLSGLVSSDDFESSLSVGPDDVGDCDADVIPALYTSETVSQIATHELRPTESSVLSIPTNLSDSNGLTSDVDPTKDVRTTIASNAGFLTKPKKINTTDLSAFNTAKESKDSWLEDYDEAAETSDTLMNLAGTSPVQKDFFPHSASPKISRRFQNASLNDSYDEEFPPDMIQQPLLSSGRKSKLKRSGSNELTGELEALPEKLPVARPSEPSASTLLSSIDAFEASFNTDFPESFSPKEGTTPTTSPSEKVVPSSAIYDPFVSASKSPTPQDPAVLSPGTESRKVSGWGSGIRDRAVAAFQRNSRRNVGADPPGNDQTCNSPGKPGAHLPLSQRLNGENPKNDTPEMSLLSLPVEGNATEISHPTVEEKADISARWLNEVKASTEKRLAEPRKLPLVYSNGVSPGVQSPLLPVGSTLSPSVPSESNTKVNHRPSPVVDRPMPTFLSPAANRHATPDSSSRTTPVAYSLNKHSTSLEEYNSKTTPVAYPPIPTVLEDNVPVFRQFSRTSPLSPSLRPTLSVVVKEDDDVARYSAPTPDSDLVHSPARIVEDLEQMQAVGFDSVRARYEKAVAPRTGTLNSSTDTRREGVRSISRTRRLEPRLKAAPDDVSNVDLEAAVTDSISSSVNVRERAAIFSSGAGAGTGSGNKAKSGWRTSTGSMEDSGDIPMRTSLSPRKLRNEEWAAGTPVVKTIAPDPTSDGLKPVALRSWRQRELSMDDGPEADQGRVGRGRTRTIALNDDEVGTSAQHRDLGKQRRHINLSGATRQIRQADRGDGASPLRGSIRGTNNREV